MDTLLNILYDTVAFISKKIKNKKINTNKQVEELDERIKELENRIREQEKKEKSGTF